MEIKHINKHNLTKIIDYMIIYTANNSRTIKVNLPSEAPVGAGTVATNHTT